MHNFLHEIVPSLFKNLQCSEKISRPCQKVYFEENKTTYVVIYLQFISAALSSSENTVAQEVQGQKLWGTVRFCSVCSLVQRFSSVTSLLRDNSYEIIFLLNHVFLQNVKYLLFLWYNMINTLTDFRKFVIGLIKTRNCSLMKNSLLYRTYCAEELSNWVKAES